MFPTISGTTGAGSPSIGSARSSSWNGCSRSRTTSGTRCNWAAPCCRSAITPYYMSLLIADDPDQPLRRTVMPDHRRVHPDGRARPTIRWARTATAPCRAWSIAIRTACCCWPSTSARPTAATARGRGWSGTARSPPNEKRLEAIFDYIRQHTRDPRRADFRRRSAGAERRAAGLDPRRELRAIPHVEFVRHRHEDAGRAAAADHAAVVPGAAEVPSAVDEPAFHPSRRMHPGSRHGPAAGWPMPASRWARRRCC